MIFGKIIRQYLTWVNPDEWRLRLLGLSRPTEVQTGRGLILIQVDGFSYDDCQRAMKKGHMPFLRQLIRREHYHFRDMYSGIPSNTPAFQGEFFFGKSQCVPSFQFWDRKTGKICTMYEKETAETIEKSLKENDEGLISGGVAYANIFAGGAKESHICASTADWTGFLKTWNPYSILVGFVLNPLGLIRGIFLCALECALAFFDFFRAVGKKEILSEFAFIFMRVLVSIMMREMITAHACIDIYRGTRVIHVNYFGYDEQAHRRGPSSRFAYWSLSGIDAAIKKIWKKAMRADRRHYEVWIYSDHGQETVKSFSAVAGKNIQQIVQELYDELYVPNVEKHFHGLAHEYSLSGDTVMSKKYLGVSKKEEDVTRPVVTMLGPVCNIYFPEKYTEEQKKLFAELLIAKSKWIPMVANPLKNGNVEYITQTGTYHLPEDVEKILGKDHPYLHSITQDLQSFFKIENRGDLVIFGWCHGSEAVSFASETGSHAGLGMHETQAFVLLPPDAPIEKNPQVIIRGNDLRQAALKILGKTKPDRRQHHMDTSEERRKLRVMSYNVHSCTGMDGILSVERIARVIAKSSPDIVALQELDSGRRIKGGDQAAAIARELEMNFHFHAVCGLDQQCFGNAILSSYPLKLIQAENLPALRKSKIFEPRGVLWVEIDFYGHKIQVLNTHLSIWQAEMQIQIEKLLGLSVLGNPDLKGDVILCGDFNMTPASKYYRQLEQHFKPPAAHKRTVSLNTWMSQWPMRQLDHILARGHLRGEFVTIPRTRLEKNASDHLPIVADFHLTNAYHPRTGFGFQPEPGSG